MNRHVTEHIKPRRSGKRANACAFLRLACGTRIIARTDLSEISAKTMSSDKQQEIP